MDGATILSEGLRSHSSFGPGDGQSTVLKKLSVVSGADSEVRLDRERERERQVKTHRMAVTATPGVL